MGIDPKTIIDPAKRKLFELAAAGGKVQFGGTVTGLPKPEKRLRQSEDDCKLNKLEAAWLEHLKQTLTTGVETLKAQSLRFRLGNGAWYRPDISAVVAGRLTLWECKGPSQMKGASKGTMTVKVAAAIYPEFSFVFVWRKGGQWHTQRVLP